MRRRARILVLAVTVTAATACTSARPAPCPGDPIATLPMHAVLRTGEGGCAFTADDPDPNRVTQRLGAAGVKASFDFAATLALASDGTALLCPERAEASPLRGTIQGDHLSVAGPPVAANVPSNVCACSLQVSETLEGTLSRSESGSVAFEGTLRDVLTMTEGVDPASCEPVPTADQPGPRCGAPCELHWTVSDAR